MRQGLHTAPYIQIEKYVFLYIAPTAHHFYVYSFLVQKETRVNCQPLVQENFSPQIYFSYELHIVNIFYSLFPLCYCGGMGPEPRHLSFFANKRRTFDHRIILLSLICFGKIPSVKTNGSRGKSIPRHFSNWEFLRPTS